MRWVMIAALLVYARPTVAGPFGLEQGMTLAQVKALTELAPGPKPGLYKAKTLPKGVSAFDFYILRISPKYGLCRVGGIGKDIRTSAFGNELRAEFESLESALVAKYGAGRSYDFLRSGSMWSEPQYWMMSLLKKERTLSHTWFDKSVKDGDLSLPDNLESLVLRVEATSTEKGYVRINYEFKNVDACDAEAKASDNAGL